MDAVSDDHGHPFLYACLMNPKAQANEAKVGRPPIDVNITNLQDMVIQGLTPEMKQQMEELLETPEYDPSAENKTWVDKLKNTPKIGSLHQKMKNSKSKSAIFPKKMRQSLRRLELNLTLK